MPKTETQCSSHVLPGKDKCSGSHALSRTKEVSTRAGRKRRSGGECFLLPALCSQFLAWPGLGQGPGEHTAAWKYFTTIPLSSGGYLWRGRQRREGKTLQIQTSSHTVGPRIPLRPSVSGFYFQSPWDKRTLEEGRLGALMRNWQSDTWVPASAQIPLPTGLCCWWQPTWRSPEGTEQSWGPWAGRG